MSLKRRTGNNATTYIFYVVAVLLIALVCCSYATNIDATPTAFPPTDDETVDVDAVVASLQESGALSEAIGQAELWYEDTKLDKIEYLAKLYELYKQDEAAAAAAQAATYSDDLDIQQAKQESPWFEENNCPGGKVQCWLRKVYLKIPDIIPTISVLSVDVTLSDLLCRDMDVQSIKSSTNTDKTWPTWRPGQTVDIADFGLNIIANKMTCRARMRAKGLLIINLDVTATLTISNLQLDYSLVMQTRDGWSIYNFRQGDTCNTKVGSVAIAIDDMSLISRILQSLQSMLGGIIQTVFCQMAKLLIGDLSQMVFEFLVEFLTPYLHEHQPLAKNVDMDKLKNTFRYRSPEGDEAVDQVVNSLYDDVMVWGESTLMNQIDRVMNGLSQEQIDSGEFIDEWYYGLLQKNLDTVNCIMDVVTNGTGDFKLETFNYTDPYATMPNITINLMDIFNVTVGVPHITASGLNTFKELIALQVNRTTTDDKNFDIYNKISLAKVAGALNASLILTPLDGEGYSHNGLKPLFESFSAKVEMLEPKIQLGLRPVLNVTNLWKTKIGPFCQAEGLLPCAVSIFDGTWDADGGLQLSKLIIETTFGEMSAWSNPGWETPLEMDIVLLVQNMFKLLSKRFPTFLQIYLRQLGGSLIRELGNELIYNMTKTAITDCDAATPFWIDETIDPITGPQYVKWSESKIMELVQFVFKDVIQGVGGFNQAMKCLIDPSVGLGLTEIDWDKETDRINNDQHPTQEEAYQDWVTKYNEYYEKFANWTNMPLFQFHDFSLTGFDSGYKFKFMEPLKQAIDELGVVFNKDTKDTIQNLEDDFKLYTEIALGSSCQTLESFVAKAQTKLNEIQDKTGHEANLLSLIFEKEKTIMKKLCSRYTPKNAELLTPQSIATQEYTQRLAIQEELNDISVDFRQIFNEIKSYILTQYPQLGDVTLLEDLITTYMNDHLTTAPTDEFFAKVAKYVELTKLLTPKTKAAAAMVIQQADAPYQPRTFDGALDTTPQGPIRGYASFAMPFTRHFMTANVTIQFDSMDVAMQGDFKVNLNTFNQFTIERLFSLCVFSLLDGFNFDNLNISFDKFLLNVDLLLQDNAVVYHYNNIADHAFLTDILNDMISSLMVSPIQKNNKKWSGDIFEFLSDLSDDKCKAFGPLPGLPLNTSSVSDAMIELIKSKTNINNNVDILQSFDGLINDITNKATEAAGDENILIAAYNWLWEELRIPENKTLFEIDPYEDLDVINLATTASKEMIPIMEPMVQQIVHDFLELETPADVLKWTAVIFPLLTMAVGVAFVVLYYFYTTLFVGHFIAPWTFLYAAGRGSTTSPVLVLHPDSPLVKQQLGNKMKKNHQYGVINPNWLINYSLADNKEQNNGIATWFSAIGIKTFLSSMFYNQWSVTVKQQDGIIKYLQSQQQRNITNPTTPKDTINSAKVIDLTLLSQQTGITIDVLTGSSLVHSPSLPFWYRTLIPTLLAANFLLIIPALYTNGAIVRVIFTVMGQIFDLGTVFNFNVTTLVDYMLYGPRGPTIALFFLFGVFCGFFAFIRVPLFLAIWCMPAKVLPLRLRHNICQFLSHLSRWLLLEAFILSMFLVAFRMYLPLIPGYVDSDTVVKCEPAFFIFLAQSLVSHVMASVIIASHRYSIRNTKGLEEDDEEEEEENNVEAVSVETAEKMTKEEKKAAKEQVKQQKKEDKQFKISPWQSLMFHRHTICVISEDQAKTQDERLQRLFSELQETKAKHNTREAKTIASYQEKNPQNIKPTGKTYAIKAQFTPLATLAFFGWIALTLVFLFLGITEKCFRIHLGGMSGWFMTPDYAVTDYSVLDVAKAIPNSVVLAGKTIYPESEAGLNFIVFIFYFFIIIAPVIFLAATLILWVAPLSNDAHKALHNFTEAIYAWNGIDAFAISVLGSVLELTKLSAALLGDLCDFLNPFIEQTLTNAGLIVGYTTCFSVLAFPLIGSLYLILAAGGCWLTALMCLKVSESAIADRHAAKQQLLQLRQKQHGIAQMDNTKLDESIEYLTNIQKTIGTYKNLLTLSTPVKKMPISLTVANLLSKVWFVTLCKEEIFYTTDVIGRYTEVYNTVKSNDALLKPNDKVAVDIEQPSSSSSSPQKQEQQPQLARASTVNASAPPRPPRANSRAPPPRPTRAVAGLTLNTQTDKKLENGNDVEMMTLADEQQDRFSSNSGSGGSSNNNGNGNTFINSPTEILSVQSPQSMYNGGPSQSSGDLGLARAQSTRSDY